MYYMALHRSFIKKSTRPSVKRFSGGFNTTDPLSLFHPPYPETWTSTTRPKHSTYFKTADSLKRDRNSCQSILAIFRLPKLPKTVLVLKLSVFIYILSILNLRIEKYLKDLCQDTMDKTVQCPMIWEIVVQITAQYGLSLHIFTCLLLESSGNAT